MSLYLPGGHAWQEEPSLSGPVYPGLQVQLALPSESVKEFVEQFEQTDAFAKENLPDAQGRHMEELSAAATRTKDPARQPTHAELPLTLLNDPGLHALQTPPSAPVYPELQLQLMTEKLPCLELEWGPHCTHTLDPAVLLYVPSSHGKQSEVPSTALYLPSGHAQHTPSRTPK